MQVVWHAGFVLTDSVGDTEVALVETHLRGAHRDLLPAHVDFAAEEHVREADEARLAHIAVV